MDDDELAKIYDTAYDGFRDANPDMELQEADDRAHRIALRAILAVTE